MSQNEKSILMPSQLFDKLYQYLLDKPYRDVSSLVDEIRNSVQIVELPKEEKEDVGTE
jgi:hypothetical protein